jgi:hypothetical protein
MATANYSWPHSPQAASGRAATVVDTNPPDTFSAWPNRNRPQVGPSGWPIPEPPARPQRRLQRPLPRGNPAAVSVSRSRPVGRWLLVFSLWAFAAGLFAAPVLSSYADRGVEAALPRIRIWAPAFLRPYLPKPIEAPRALPRHATAARTVPATPAAPERPAKRAQPHSARGTHAKSAGASHPQAEAGDPFEAHVQ